MTRRISGIYSYLSISYLAGANAETFYRMVYLRQLAVGDRPLFSFREWEESKFN